MKIKYVPRCKDTGRAAELAEEPAGKPRDIKMKPCGCGSAACIRGKAVLTEEADAVNGGHGKDREKQFISFLRRFQEIERGIMEKSEKQVMIEKAVNLRQMCDYVVSCSYGDIVLIICMLRDYIRMLDETRADDLWYQSYYRKKFVDLSKRLAEQVGYDYDKAVEKCKKKQQKRESSSDIGEDGLAQLINRTQREK